MRKEEGGGNLDPSLLIPTAIDARRGDRKTTQESVHAVYQKSWYFRGLLLILQACIRFTQKYNDTGFFRALQGEGLTSVV